MPEGVPHLPVWLCSVVLGHWGYLLEVRQIDDRRSEYVCRACGWQGVKERPPKRIRWHWF